MAEFKVGDRVVIKGTLYTGRHGMVTRYEPLWAFKYEVALDDTERYCWYYAKELDKEEQDGKAE